MIPNEGHLVLSRRIGEVVCIGEEIELEVVSIHGNQVRLIFRAPRTLKIDRKEIRAKILKEREISKGIGKDFDEGAACVQLVAHP